MQPKKQKIKKRQMLHSHAAFFDWAVLQIQFSNYLQGHDVKKVITVRTPDRKDIEL